MPCIGVVDRFDEYFGRLQVQLSNWFGRQLDGKPPRANASTERAVQELAKSIDQLEQLLGPDLSARFYEMNRFDCRFYAQTASMAERQILKSQGAF
jgi:hypothetical protein